MNQENVGKFMASLRKDGGLTQEQFAEKLGVNSRSVSRWENGYCMPDLSLLQMISDELNVSVSELLNGKRERISSFLIKEDAYVQNYKILMEMSKKELLGEDIEEKEKQRVVSTLLSGIACSEDVFNYKKRMRVNPATDNTYPNYYIPPYNGNKKLRLIQGYLPKTHILYANHYELEILRLLYILAPENKEINEMVQRTLHRLRNTCFGNSCTQGECFATGISVLRFLETTRPSDKEWIERLRIPLEDYLLTLSNGHTARQSGIPVSYLLMAFADGNSERISSLVSWNDNGNIPAKL